MSFRDRLIVQFHQPTGLLGRLAGLIMAHRSSNRERNSWTVGLLDIQPEDHVLELGFGPGLAIEEASRLAHRGRVVGLDHSETMVRVATRRNAKAIRDGRVHLELRSFEQLDDLDDRFDKILAVNALILSDDAGRVARSLHCLLRPGGTLAITFQSRKAGATSRDTERGGEKLATLLRECGFSDVRTEVLPLEPVSAVCVLGSK